MVPIDFGAVPRVFLFLTGCCAWLHSNTPPRHVPQNQPGDVFYARETWVKPLIVAIDALKIFMMTSTALDTLLSLAPTIFAGTPFFNTYFPNHSSIMITRAALVGNLLMILGAAIRFKAVRDLGNFFTWRVTIRRGHELVRTGLYRYIRHPAYTGLLLGFFGAGLAHGPGAGGVMWGFSLGGVGYYRYWLVWVLWWAVWGLPAWLVKIRIGYEEQVLEKRFGEEWRAHARATWVLVPGVY